MTANLHPHRTSDYKPAVAWFAYLGSAWVFVLVALGAFTTSIGAGMAFLDWPLSNGSVNPAGWLTEIDKFSEHSHRLSASVMSAVTIILAAVVWRTEQRAWLRKLALFAVGLVLFQAMVGGLRVLLDHWHVEMVDTSVGRLFAMLHACLAQLFACTLIAIACALSKGWVTRTTPVSCGVRRAGAICCALIFCQLAIAAVMRHSFAGMAIPTFPASAPDGSWLPPAWNFRVGIHFAHRCMAAVLSVALVGFALKIWRDRGATLILRCGAALLVNLLILQVGLGAWIIWSQRSAAMTTGHVLVGAATLVTTFGLTWLAHRDVVEAHCVN
ncbi:MAG: COX15/CtaA family protein [Opitutaceae bacterium]